MRPLTFLAPLRTMYADKNRLVWLLLLQSVAFIIPAFIHYWYNEWCMTVALLAFTVQRCIYHIPKYDWLTNHTLFSSLYIITHIAIFSCILWHSLLYRLDITSLCMSLSFIVFLLVGDLTVHLLSQQTKATDQEFILWQSLLFVALFCNLVWRDMSSPVIMSHFIKGVFWGVVGTLGVQHKVWLVFNDLQNYITEKNTITHLDTKKQ